MNYTDFGAYSHGQLRKMAEALNPGEVMAASDPWRRAADTLKAIRTTLTRASTEAAVSWEGSTSDAFHARMLQLAGTINNTAAYANDAAITLKAMSEAIAKAKRDMPEEPSGWDQFKDGVGDTVSSLFGGDDEDTKTAVVEQKKAEAVAVMQTLAMHYRVATPMLKPPPPPPPPLRTGRPGRADVEDTSATSGADGSAAVGAMMAGAGLGSTGTRSAAAAAPSPQTVKRPGAPVSQRPVGAVSATAPVSRDSGIKGGAAQVLPKLPSATNFGPGTGIDGVVPVLSAGPGGSAAAPGAPGAGSGHGAPGGLAGGPHGGGQGAALPGGLGVPGGGARGGASGLEGEPLGRGGARGVASVRGGSTFGVGGVQGGAFAGEGRSTSGVKSGAGPRRIPGVVGEGGHPAAGASGRQAFTEGGSGLGARNRGRGEEGAGAAMGPGSVAPLSDRQGRRKGKEKDGKRPAYLVEDEETWASGKQTNPNVVE